MQTISNINANAKRILIRLHQNHLAKISLETSKRDKKNILTNSIFSATNAIHVGKKKSYCVICHIFKPPIPFLPLFSLTLNTHTHTPTPKSLKNAHYAEHFEYSWILYSNSKVTVCRT